LVKKLRGGDTYIPELALVMADGNDGDRLIGHIMLTKIAIKGVKSLPKNTFEILLLAPVAIAIDRRNRGLGSDLIREALKKAKNEGYAAVISTGDPRYFERLGFVSAGKFNIKNKQNIPDENVLVYELVSGILEGIEGTVDFFG